MAGPGELQGQGNGRKRRFVRHTAGVPLKVRTIRRDGGEPHALHDVSFGGLSFESGQPIEAGTELELQIGDVRPPFSAKARVVWCHHTESGYRIGVKFLEERDAFRSRMVEQVCAIEQYRKEVGDREGRQMSSSEAAHEWIERFADRFPGKD